MHDGGDDMKQPEFGITQFVRGMAWHDLGKPFHLGTGGHVWLGYWLLVRADYSAEALVALTHGGGEWSKGLKEVLKPYLKQNGDTLPAILLFANPLDRISASVYSLLARRIDLDTFKGKKDDPEEKKNPLFHARQNPFSRLPMRSDELDSLFTIRESNDDAQVPHSRVEQLDEPLRDRLIAALPDEWKLYIQPEGLDAATQSKFALQAQPAPADGRALLEALETFQHVYPERTYPPANDTSLGEHTRLSSALAFVLYRNLEQKALDWLSKRIWRLGNDYILGAEGDTKEVHRCLNPGDEEAWNEARRMVSDHLGACLVRVAFEGHRELFENAVRVDDLLGARALTQRLLDAFERELTQVLGVPDLVWESEDDERLSPLTISRSQFDLFYLLPLCPDPKGEMTIEEALDQAYEQALDVVVQELIADLKQDFRRAVTAGKLTFGYKEAQLLRRQLRTLGYRLRVLDLAAPDPDQLPTFADFTSRYGNALVEKFRQSQAYARVPLDDLPGQPGGVEDEALPADGTCDVCGNHPVFQPFAILLEDETWRPYVQKAIHHFRGEPERPCISCIARRILAHGKVAEGLEPVLQRMIGWADDRSRPPRRLTVRRLEAGPDLPPGMVSSAVLEDEDDFVDLGAVYARFRREKGVVRFDASPQLFPTVSYAADATGNVVLLAIQPNEALYEEYVYTEAVAQTGNLAEEIKRGDRNPETDEERWQASFVLLYRWVKEKEKEEKGDFSDEQTSVNGSSLSENMITIRPHLARIMERISHLRSFYRDLSQALMDARIRILPLDTDFPTLRLLLPADQLDKGLCVLDRVLTESFFSATYFEDPETQQLDLEKRRRSHKLLELLVPDLLHGAVVLFKHKFPLYLALEAERALFHHLAMTDERKESTGRPSRCDWYGLRLAFTDLRGTLSQAGPILAETSYTDVGTVLELARQADRRTVLVQGETVQYISPELARALTMIRTTRTTLTPSQAKELNRKEIFPPVLFLKQAIRR
jgi:hypothetical protein